MRRSSRIDGKKLLRTRVNFSNVFVRRQAELLFATAATLACISSPGCSNDPRPLTKSAEAADRSPRVAVTEHPSLAQTDTPYRAKLDHAELFVPPWFTPKDGRYDLIVHFHGMGKLQEHNLEIARLNAAVVSVNYGVGTEAYGNAYRDPRTFTKLLASVQDEIAKSGRTEGARLGRIALSAWSAGFVCVSKILGDPSSLSRVDAVLLADGFFTSYLDPKKHIVNAAPLERFVHLAEAAERGDKLFGITHTTIPTSGYPSVEETVGKLLEMTNAPRVATHASGPESMRELYAVDRGSFHVRGYEGVLAGDHIKQIHAMGETLWPYLKSRWEPAAPNGTDGTDTTAGTSSEAKPAP